MADTFKSETSKFINALSQIMALHERAVRWRAVEISIDVEQMGIVIAKLKEVGEVLNFTRGSLAGARERSRHVTDEGWSPEHDDHHKDGALAIAGACYALPESKRRRTCWLDSMTHSAIEFFVALWPWEIQWWKPTPTNRKRELEKAMALCAAEWDRIDRKEKGVAPGTGLDAFPGGAS